MKHSNYLLFLIISLFFSCEQETIQLKEIGIIPKPLFQEINKGVFVLDENIRFISNTELNEVSDYLKLYIEENYQVSFTPQKESKKIVFTSNDTISNEEGYELKIEESNNATVFSSDNTITSNIFKSHNLEFPFELRWRSSTANKYNFWRIYGGVKFIYNMSNSFQYIDVNNIDFNYSNVSAYNKLQYGLTLSAGYDKFNINVFYGLTPVFNDAKIEGEKIETKAIKFGLILYLL